MTTFDKFMKMVKEGYVSSNDPERWKSEWKSVSLKLMKQLAEDLDLVEKKIYFNPGGIAVSGDYSMRGRSRDGKFIHVFGDADLNFMVARSMKNLDDYCGGTNHPLMYKDLSYKTILATCQRILAM